MSDKTKRHHIESALTLDIRRMKRAGMLYDGKSGALRWNSPYVGGELASVEFAIAMTCKSGTLTLKYFLTDQKALQDKVISCTITLSSIPLHYGGRRWYMHCPLSNRRTQTLQKWPDIEQFCHRTAVCPPSTYASQRVSGLGRAILQFETLRRSLPKLQRRRRVTSAEMEHYLARATDLKKKQTDHLRRILGRCGGTDQLNQWI
jgi:hypothetical protein